MSQASAPSSTLGEISPAGLSPPPPPLLSDAAESDIWPRARAAISGWLPVRAELAVLGALLVVMGAFGRGFSKLELGLPWLHVTEVVLLGVLVAAAIRVPPATCVERLRATGVLVPIAIFWLVGLVALVRGIAGPGFDDVLHDVGLLEYSILVPLLAVLVADRRSFLWMCRAIVLAGLLGGAALALSTLTPAEWRLGSELGLVAAASGMYTAIFVVWVLARRGAGLRAARWEYAAVVLGCGLIVVGSARSAWLALLGGFVCVVALSLRGRRVGIAAQMTAVIVVGTAVASAAQEARTLPLPSPSDAAIGLADIRSLESDASEAGLAAASTPAPATRHTSTQPQSHPAPAHEQDPPHAARSGPEPDSLFANSGIERGTLRGYNGFPPNELAVSSEMAHAGGYSLAAAYVSDPRLAKADTYLPLVADTWYRASAWVFLPADWDGGAVSISTDRTWAGAEERAGGSATTTPGRWIRLRTEFAPESQDLVGGVHIRTADGAVPGSVVYIDDVSIEPIGPVRPPPVTAPASPPAGDPTVTAEATGLAELPASFRGSSQRANAEWRLAFWGFLLAETAQRPLWGAGFGAPSDFTWSGIRYDGRTGDTDEQFDVSGPHNSFINVLYRTGLPGFLALMAILLIAAIRLVALARRSNGLDRAMAIWLLAAGATATVAASLNVALEGPFMGVFFWAILGLALIAPRFLGDTPSATASAKIAPIRR